MGFDPELARLAGRVGAYAQHARHDVRLTTSAARSAFLAGFEQQVDPGGILAVEERARRAASARRAHFARLAMLSARARRRSLASRRDPNPDGQPGA